VPAHCYSREGRVETILAEVNSTFGETHNYWAYCEGAFLERHVGDFQLLLTRNHNPGTLFQEPWGEHRVELELGRGAVR
jgi:hypothetical protein